MAHYVATTLLQVTRNVERKRHTSANVFVLQIGSMCTKGRSAKLTAELVLESGFLPIWIALYKTVVTVV